MPKHEELSLAERLATVAGELGAIGKREVDQKGAGKFQAFAVDDIYSHLRPLLSDVGVVVVPYVESVDYSPHQGRNSVGTRANVLVRYEFHGAGEVISARFAAEGIDYSDKATNKAVQQALKYCLIQMFQISTGEVDPDALEVEPAVDDGPTRLVKNTIYQRVGKDAERAESIYHQVEDTLGIETGTMLSDDESKTAMDLLGQLLGAEEVVE